MFVFPIFRCLRACAMTMKLPESDQTQTLLDITELIMKGNRSAAVQSAFGLFLSLCSFKRQAPLLAALCIFIRFSS